MLIKVAKTSDLETVYRIVQQTIHAVYFHYYAKGAVEFFLEHHSQENIAADIRSGTVFLCINAEETAVGTMTLKRNELCRLFVLPEYQNKGYGGALIDFAEAQIFKEYDRVVLDASLPAKRMYRNRGYREIESDIIKANHGDYLCYDRMCKSR